MTLQLELLLNRHSHDESSRSRSWIRTIIYLYESGLLIFSWITFNPLNQECGIVSKQQAVICFPLLSLYVWMTHRVSVYLIPDAGAETLAVKSDTRREAEADYQSRVTHSSCHPGSLIRQGLQGNVHVFILLFCLSFVVACFILMRLWRDPPLFNLPSSF